MSLNSNGMLRLKKELGDDYGMVKFGNAIAEWDDSSSINRSIHVSKMVLKVLQLRLMDISITLLALTMKDGGYTTLAEALELAKAGNSSNYLEHNKSLCYWS